MSYMNKLAVIHNQYQHFDQYKRVLIVCSGGCLRSPTAANVLAQEPYNFNTRSAGCTEEYAIVPVTDALVEWADQIVFMELWMRTETAQKFDLSGKATVVLDIRDRYEYRAEELIDLIRTRYNMGHSDE